MTFDDRVIVLNTTRVKENSIVLHTISETYGRKSYLVRIGRNTGMSYFLPLNILEISVTENPKSDLWYARAISAEVPLNSIRDNIYKNTISLFMAIRKTGSMTGSGIRFCPWMLWRVISATSISAFCWSLPLPSASVPRPMTFSLSAVNIRDL